MRRIRAIPVAAFLILLLANAPAMSAEPWVSGCRANYNKQLVKIQSAQRVVESAWLAKYMRDLKVLEDAVQASGDLEALLSVRKEFSRFKASKAIPSDAYVDTPPQLRNLQEKYGEAGEVDALGMNRQILVLVEKYVSFLEARKKEYTIAGDLSNALAAKEEIDRVNSSDVVTDAQASVDMSTDEPRGANGVGHESNAAPEPVAEIIPTAPDGYVIYPRGDRPPRVSGQVFTRTSLSSTGNTPAAKRVVSVGASMYSKANMTQSKGRYGSSKRTATTSVLRLQVRSSRAGTTLENQVVKVKFFTRSAKAGPRPAPSATRSGTVTLPALTSEGYYIDFPELTTTRTITKRAVYSRSSSSSSARRRYSTSESGTEYYGILVSVYNGDGSLSYQGMSTKGLKAQAAAAAK